MRYFGTKRVEQIDEDAVAAERLMAIAGRFKVVSSNDEPIETPVASEVPTETPVASEAASEALVEASATDEQPFEPPVESGEAPEAQDDQN